MDLKPKLDEAIKKFWEVRTKQLTAHQEAGGSSEGERGAVTGGAHLVPLEGLVKDALMQLGIKEQHIRVRPPQDENVLPGQPKPKRTPGPSLDVPGYFRPKKNWDLLVVIADKLYCAVEFKSVVGPSYGNNYNNRVEEAIGSAYDLRQAFTGVKFEEKGAFKPVLGFFLVVQDEEKSTVKPVRPGKTKLGLDQAFVNATYAKRYAELCNRFIESDLYDAACLVLAKKEVPGENRHLEGFPNLTLDSFVQSFKDRIGPILEAQEGS